MTASKDSLEECSPARRHCGVAQVSALQGFFVPKTKIMKTEGIIMGVGAPNETKSGAKTMCAIVLTKNEGFIRIYPIPAHEIFPVWGKVALELEKGNDGRDSTWKLVRWSLCGKIDKAEEKHEILSACELKSGMDDPCDYMNKLKKSIYLVKLDWGNIELVLSQKIPLQIADDDEEYGWIMTQARHWLKPYIKWKSQQGKKHKSHMGGREIYEGLRRNPTEPWNLMNNLQVMNPDYETWMLMGNMKDYTNVWLCVHFHRLKKQIGGSIPLFCNPIIGEKEGWPYEKQKERNVSIVDGHGELFTMSDMTQIISTRGSMATTI